MMELAIINWGNWVNKLHAVSNAAQGLLDKPDRWSAGALELSVLFGMFYVHNLCALMVLKMISTINPTPSPVPAAFSRHRRRGAAEPLVRPVLYRIVSYVCQSAYWSVHLFSAAAVLCYGFALDSGPVGCRAVTPVDRPHTSE